MNIRTTLAGCQNLALTLPVLFASACVGVDEAEDDIAVTKAALEEVAASSACDYPSGYYQNIINVTFQIDPAMDAAPAAENMDEKCRVWYPYLWFLGLNGRQIRVTANGRTGLCTVDDTPHELEAGQAVVLMSTEGFQKKFGTTVSPQTGSWATHVLTPVTTCGWVAQQLESITDTPNSTIGLGEFYAPPTSSPAARRVAFTAPHGGGIETGTWEQVQHIHGRHAADAYFWLVRSSGNSAHDRWHITSDDVSYASFSGLDRFRAGFSAGNGDQVRDQVVGFHGYNPANYDSCSADVLIGGDAPLVLREGLAAAAELWGTYRGVTIDALADFAGTDCPRGQANANYVNELSDFGEGIHIEQSVGFKGVAAKRNALAEAVAHYVLGYNSVSWTAVGGNAASSPSTTDVGLGGFWSVPYTGRVRSGATYGTCRSSNDRGHVDWFVRAGTTLTRIGGGPLVCNGSNQFVPGAGFQAVDYTNTTGGPVKVRVAGVAYTKNTSGATIQLKALLMWQ